MDLVFKKRTDLMSEVSSVILSFAIGETTQRIIKELQGFKYNGKDSFDIVSIDDDFLPQKWYGGSKMMECNICIGSYNYLDIEGLVAFLHDIEWEYPEDVQLLIRQQNDSKFRLIEISQHRGDT